MKWPLSVKAFAPCFGMDVAMQVHHIRNLYRGPTPTLALISRPHEADIRPIAKTLDWNK